MRRIYLLLIIGACAGCFFVGLRIGRQDVPDSSELLKLNREIDSLRNEWLASQVRTNKLKEDTARYLARARAHEELAINREKRTVQLKKQYGKEIEELRNQVSAFTDAGLDSFYRARYYWPEETAIEDDAGPGHGDEAERSDVTQPGEDNISTRLHDIKPQGGHHREGFSPEGNYNDANGIGVQGEGVTEVKRERAGEDRVLEGYSRKIQAPKEFVPWRCCTRSGSWYGEVFKTVSRPIRYPYHPLDHRLRQGSLGLEHYQTHPEGDYQRRQASLQTHSYPQEPRYFQREEQQA